MFKKINPILLVLSSLALAANGLQTFNWTREEFGICEDAFVFKKDFYWKSKACQSYVTCMDGKPVEIFCDNQNVFDEEKKICMHNTLTTRTECKAKSAIPVKKSDGKGALQRLISIADSPKFVDEYAMPEVEPIDVEPKVVKEEPMTPEEAEETKDAMLEVTMEMIMSMAKSSSTAEIEEALDMLLETMKKKEEEEKAAAATKRTQEPKKPMPLPALIQAKTKPMSKVVVPDSHTWRWTVDDFAICRETVNAEEELRFKTTNCGSYVTCIEGAPYERFCDYLEVFDAATKECVDQRKTTRNECKVRPVNERPDRFCNLPNSASSIMKLYQNDVCGSFYVCGSEGNFEFRCEQLILAMGKAHIIGTSNFAFNEETGKCEHMAVTTRNDCKSKVAPAFREPTDIILTQGFKPILCDPDNTYMFGDHNTMANPFDCSTFFLCFKHKVLAGDIIPTIRGCPDGKVYSDKKKLCVFERVKGTVCKRK